MACAIPENMNKIYNKLRGFLYRSWLGPNKNI
jgi:hypothetical protein